jgi:hypothetical protein
MSSKNAKVRSGRKGGKVGGKETGKDQNGRKEVKPKEVTVEPEDSDNGIEEKLEHKGTVRAQADQTDIDAMKAIMSINTINLMAPPLPLKFGRWNSRPLDVSKATQLLASMKEHDFRMFKMESMIPLIMKREDIVDDAIKTNVTDGLGADAPELKLTELGKKKAYLYAAGGRHRYWAIEKEVGDVKKEIAHLKEAIEESEKGDLIEEKIKEIKELEEYMATISKWGVIVYDEGEQHFVLRT